MKFYTLAEARYYVTTHAPAFQTKLRIVKTRYWSVDGWCWIPCYTVVLK